MFKSYIVFPPGMQPTIGQVKIWNAHVHLLKGVHWGTERQRTDQLAVEIDTESLHQCLRQEPDFEELLATWSRRGAEICDRFEFQPDRNVLKPVNESKAAKPASVRLLPDKSVPFLEPKESARSVSHGSSPMQSYHQLGLDRIGQVTQRASRGGPWLLAGVFALGTLLVGAYMARELRRSGMERRQDTIERIDQSIRENPRGPMTLDTQFPEAPAADRAPTE